MPIRTRKQKKALIAVFLFFVIAFLPSALMLSHTHEEGVTSEHCMICAFSNALAGMLRLVLAGVSLACARTGLATVWHVRRLIFPRPKETLVSLRVRLNP